MEMQMQMQQRPAESKRDTDHIVEEVYLNSFQDLRKSGKDAKEAFRIAKDLSLAAGLVVKSEIALCAIRLYLQDASNDSSIIHTAETNGIDKKEECEENDDDENEDSHPSERDGEMFGNDSHVIPMK